MKQYIIILSVVAKDEEDAKRIIQNNTSKYLNKGEIFTSEEYEELLEED